MNTDHIYIEALECNIRLVRAERDKLSTENEALRAELADAGVLLRITGSSMLEMIAAADQCCCSTE